MSTQPLTPLLSNSELRTAISETLAQIRQHTGDTQAALWSHLSELQEAEAWRAKTSMVEEEK